MKNFLRSLWVGIAALALISTIAWAAMNLRQNADGTADFVSGTGNAYKVGRQVLSAQFADIATASTIYVAATVDGTITGWGSVINNAISSADCVLTLEYNDDWANAVSTLTITQSGSAAGDYDSASGLTRAVTAGAKIKILSDGACNTTTITPVKVFIDPR